VSLGAYQFMTYPDELVRVLAPVTTMPLYQTARMVVPMPTSSPDSPRGVASATPQTLRHHDNAADGGKKEESREEDKSKEQLCNAAANDDTATPHRIILFKAFE
jgi:hypothetical protein